MKILALIISILMIQSCRMSRKLNSVNNAIVDRVLIVPVVVAKALTEASSEIYSINSLIDNTPVTMEVFKVEFYGKRDTIQFNFENVSFYFLNDTVHYTNFVFPNWDINKYEDSMLCVVNCSYVNPFKETTQCLTGSYSVVNGKISKHEKYQLCE